MDDNDFMQVEFEATARRRDAPDSTSRVHRAADALADAISDVFDHTSDDACNIADLLSRLKELEERVHVLEERHR